MSLRFPEPFRHSHPKLRSVNEIVEEKMTLGERTADTVARRMGSWRFIIIQSSILAMWVALNVIAIVRHWDPYPFILMNLMLSLQAAYAAPIIMMSQNRLASKDRIEAHNDFLVNLKSEEEARAILEHLEAQNEALLAIHTSLLELHRKADARIADGG